MVNPRVVKKVAEIDNQISKLQNEKIRMLSWRSQYDQFHLARIEDILFKGTVKTQQNMDTTNKIEFEDTEGKLNLLVSSLFEMGLIEDFDIEQKIQKNIRDFFNSE